MANVCSIPPLLFVMLLLVASASHCFTAGDHEFSFSSAQKRELEDEYSYVFDQDSFLTTIQSEAGQIRALPNFSAGAGCDLPPGPGLEDYSVAYITMDPRSILLPHYIEADLALYVTGGRGRIAFVHEQRLVERVLNQGDVYAIPPGLPFYILNTDDRRQLLIHALLRTQCSTRFYESFYVVGGRNPADVLSVFSEDVLQAAFNTSKAVLEPMLLSGFNRGAIIAVSREQIKALSSRRIKGFGGSEEPQPFNLLDRKPDFSNKNGEIFQADAADYRVLRRLNVGVQLVKLKARSMTALHYDSRSTKIGVVLNGAGIVEMGRPQRRQGEGQQQGPTYQKIRATLNPGTVFVIPAGSPSTVIASRNAEQLQILYFELNCQGNRKQFLAGRSNVLRYLDNELKRLVFPEEIEAVLEAQEDEVLLKGPEQPRRQGHANQ